MHKKLTISGLLILLMLVSTSAFSQKYTTKQVFDSVDGFSFGHIYFSPNRDLFLTLNKFNQPHRLYHSSNSGQSWDTIPIPHNDVYNFYINSKTGSFFYQSGDKDTVFRSRDFGKRWEVFYVGNFKGSFSIGDLGELYFTPDRMGVTRVPYQSKMYLMSTDEGLRWDTVFYPKSQTKLSIKPGVACFGGGPSVIDKKGRTYHSMHDGVYYLDSADKWRRSSYWKKLLSNKQNAYCLQGLAVDSNGWLYHGINVLKDKDHEFELNTNNGRWYISYGFYIVRSKDEGMTWDTVSNFVDSVAINWGRELSQLEFDREGNMIAFTSEGIYRSKDNGKTFQKFDIPHFTYFGCRMTKDPWGNIYIVTILPDIYKKDNDNYGYRLLSP